MIGLDGFLCAVPNRNPSEDIQANILGKYFGQNSPLIQAFSRQLPVQTGLRFSIKARRPSI
jgi:hypothetical protein